MTARLRCAGWLLAAVTFAAAQPPPEPEQLEQQQLLKLLRIRRVYVDRLTGGEVAAHIREMILSSLHAARLFVVTENPERADAILRGSAEDLVFTETFAASEGLDARGSFGAGTTRTTDSQGKRTYASVGVGEHDSVRLAERRHEASAAVRLVDKDGDVIWATTQESLGGKFRGASADVADKITKQLLADYQRARRLAASGSRPADPGAGRAGTGAAAADPAAPGVGPSKAPN